MKHTRRQGTDLPQVQSIPLMIKQSVLHWCNHPDTLSHTTTHRQGGRMERPEADGEFILSSKHQF